MKELQNPITQKIILEIQKKQSCTHEFIDRKNKMMYGDTSKSLHLDTKRIDKAITYFISLSPEQIAKHLFQQCNVEDYQDMVIESCKQVADSFLKKTLYYKNNVWECDDYVGGDYWLNVSETINYNEYEVVIDGKIKEVITKINSQTYEHEKEIVTDEKPRYCGELSIYDGEDQMYSEQDYCVNLK